MVGKRKQREEEKSVVERRCVNPFSSNVFEEFSPVDDSGSFGDSWSDLCGDSCGFSECVPAVSSGVPVEMCLFLFLRWLGEVSLCVSDCEIVKSRSFPFSRKRRAFLMESQGDMNTASSPEDVEPFSRRRPQEVDCGVNQKMGSGLPIGCKKDAELLGPQ